MLPVCVEAQYAASIHSPLGAVHFATNGGAQPADAACSAILASASGTATAIRIRSAAPGELGGMLGSDCQPRLLSCPLPCARGSSRGQESRTQLAGGDWHAGGAVAASLAIGPELGSLIRRTQPPSEATRVPGVTYSLTVPVGLPIVRSWHWQSFALIRRRGERRSMDGRGWMPMGTCGRPVVEQYQPAGSILLVSLLPPAGWLAGAGPVRRKRF
jgi:hypothetical protein